MRTAIKDREAVDRITGELLALFAKFGGKRTARSRGADLPVFAGREAEFVEGLMAVAKEIEAQSDRSSSQAARAPGAFWDRATRKSNERSTLVRRRTRP